MLASGLDRAVTDAFKDLTQRTRRDVADAQMFMRASFGEKQITTSRCA